MSDSAIISNSYIDRPDAAYGRRVRVASLAVVSFLLPLVEADTGGIDTCCLPCVIQVRAC